ncbi:MAG: hypothetical protein B1H13_08295 [Desulfobacteraceae bacterium 4484_190.3]|nr:MAG: hypothetical protein B1H13_08295 [Desulfobacteraceae bacterium 4484_190.3]
MPLAHRRLCTGSRRVVFRLGRGNRAGLGEPGQVGDLAQASAHTAIYTHLVDGALEDALERL